MKKLSVPKVRKILYVIGAGLHTGGIELKQSGAALVAAILREWVVLA
jgi:hypothetical protein